MSVISSQILLVPGLKDATKEQKVDCFKDKAINNLKHAGAQLGVAAAIGGAGYAAARSEAVQDAFVKVADGTKNLLSKGADKLGKTEGFKSTIEGLKTVLKDAGMTTKQGKVSLVLGAIALAGVAVSSIIATHQIHQSGKIEGQHQAKVDAANAEA